MQYTPFNISHGSITDAPPSSWSTCRAARRRQKRAFAARKWVESGRQDAMEASAKEVEHYEYNNHQSTYS